MQRTLAVLLTAGFVLLAMSNPASAQSCNLQCPDGNLNTVRYLNPPPGALWMNPGRAIQSIQTWLQGLWNDSADPASESPIRFAGSTGNPNEALLGDIVNTDLAAWHAGEPAPAGKLSVDIEDVRSQAERISNTLITRGR